MQTTLQNMKSAKGVILTGSDACRIFSQLSDVFQKENNQRVMAVKNEDSISFFLSEGTVTLSINLTAKGGAA